MSKKTLRASAAILLLIIILALFAYYINSHPAIIAALKHIRPWLLVVLLGCYLLMLAWWMGIYNATLDLCAKPLKLKENFLLTTYSTLANFFLPLQSGPGIRAAYLKRKHKVPISSYLLSSLIYYAVYAVISAGFLFIGSRYWWLAFPAIITAAIISLTVIKFAKKRFQKKNPKLDLNLSRKVLTRLILLTIGQVATQALIYGLELHSLGFHTSLRRVLSYTGAANFALFVALTPGAIGFREAFLEFSRRLHHYSTNAILSANLIDRGVFVFFLGLLFLVTLATHAHDRLKV